MTDALTKLLALRRMRERQAAAAFEKAAGKHRAQSEHVAGLERRQAAFLVETRERISGLYAGCVGSRMSRGDLERLTATVDHLNHCQTEMRVMVAGQRQLRDHLANEAESARQARIARERTVRKLEFLLDDMASDAARAAEAAAEAELDGQARRGAEPGDA